MVPAATARAIPPRRTGKRYSRLSHSPPSPPTQEGAIATVADGLGHILSDQWSKKISGGLRCRRRVEGSFNGLLPVDNFFTQLALRLVQPMFRDSGQPRARTGF